MEIKKHLAPFPCEKMLAALEDVFGKEEADLERPQLSGNETLYNKDIVLIAEENGRVLGTVHATVPLRAPYLAGISAVATLPAARGMGLGKKLFSKMMKELEQLGVEYAFLGTSNPVAQKMYASFGFAYHSGSFVMIHCKDGGMVDLDNALFQNPQKKISVFEGSAQMRIPLIPLVLHKNDHILLDTNTGIANCELFTQCSCMGLYQKYRSLSQAGGHFFGAESEQGVLGAVASVMPTQEGTRCDFFFANGFEESIFPLLDAVQTVSKSFYLQIAIGDIKEKAATALGFLPEKEMPYAYKGVVIPALKYVKA